MKLSVDYCELVCYLGDFNRFCIQLLCHRCFGMLLQKVDSRNYVREKIDWMYKQANIACPTNRLGLAKAMGLVIDFNCYSFAYDLQH